jgi:hypothetical protein
MRSDWQERYHDPLVMRWEAGVAESTCSHPSEGGFGRVGALASDIVIG